MDAFEATDVVMSRIKKLDPENASKIMGYILIQEQGEKEVIRLAFSPEPLLLSYINRAKACLGLPSNTPSSNPSPLFSHPILPNNHFPQIPNDGFHFNNPPSPAAPFGARSSPRPMSSYAAGVDGSGSFANNSCDNGSGPSSFNLYGSGDDFFAGGGGGMSHQVQDQLPFPFLDESVVDPIMSPSGGSDSLVLPLAHPFHRRSYSVNDAAFISTFEEMSGGRALDWRPCMYFARGFCKNGSSCKFLHSDITGVEAIDVGSPNQTGSGFGELLRMKALQQRLARMASESHHSLSYNKCMDFLNGHPRNDFSPMGLGVGESSSSRQIYLTFPADSTFREEDVSKYFSIFGPVQDVRIPYQQKRMFGFVTFLYPETVKLILSKRNPHFVCDSRVLVKPYKEKGKVRDKKQQQEMELAEYSACLSPAGFDSKDLPFGPRMLAGNQEMMLRMKLEQKAELQHAVDVQGLRMMNMQLLDQKNKNDSNIFLPSFPASFPVRSPRQPQLLMSQNVSASSYAINQEATSAAIAADDRNVYDGHKLQHGRSDDSELLERLEHILPDDLFTSPTKLAGEYPSASSDDGINVKIPPNNNTPMLPNCSRIGMAPLRSCSLQISRFPSGQEAVEM